MLELFEIDDTSHVKFFQNIFYKTCFTLTVLLIHKTVEIKENIEPIKCPFCPHIKNNY